MKKYSMNNISFGYNKKEILKNISINFKPESINVLIGLNGSGKTTLLKLLSGILKPKKGLIFINDVNIFDYSYIERSKYISYVAQGLNVGNDYLVEEYLSFGIMNTLKFYQSPSIDSLKKIELAAKKFKIHQFLKINMNKLSGGERQIVSICRAYLQDTKIILLDEPTSALDFKNQIIVLNILKEITSIGKTIILSTHNPNHALYLNSNSILLDKGTIIKCGSAKEIVNKDVLSSVYGNTIKYSKELEYDEVTII